MEILAQFITLWTQAVPRRFADKFSIKKNHFKCPYKEERVKGQYSQMHDYLN